jgi:hypothetical protein
MSGERWWADGTAVKDEKGLRVANCGLWQDALLCAAAPELLDALRACEEFIGEHYGRCGYTAPPDTLRKVRAAIAAAVRVRE